MKLWPIVKPVTAQNIFLGILASGTDEYFGSANWQIYDGTNDPIVIIPSFESLDLSATFVTETSSGSEMKITVFGNDVLEEGGRIARPFDAGIFGFAAPAKRQHFGMKVGFEF